MLTLSRDVHFINTVMNDPTVHPWISLGQEGPLDMTALLEDPRNLFLCNEWGGFMFVYKGENVYEVHTQFLPGGRGQTVREAAKEAMAFMFTQTACEAITTYCPLDNPPARFLAKGAGMNKVGKAYPMGKDCDMYIITKGEWQCR